MSDHETERGGERQFIVGERVRPGCGAARSDRSASTSGRGSDRSSGTRWPWVRYAMASRRRITTSSTGPMRAASSSLVSTTGLAPGSAAPVPPYAATTSSSVSPWAVALRSTSFETRGSSRMRAWSASRRSRCDSPTVSISTRCLPDAPAGALGERVGVGDRLHRHAEDARVDAELVVRADAVAVGRVERELRGAVADRAAAASLATVVVLPTPIRPTSA